MRYANLHTTAFVDKQLFSLPAANGSAAKLPIPADQGGSLDVEVSFDLSEMTAGSGGEFGVALRSPNNNSDPVLGAALTLYFNASAPDADGTRIVHVRTTQRLRPSVPSAPLPPLPVLKGERLTIRALIDRPYIECVRAFCSCVGLVLHGCCAITHFLRDWNAGCFCRVVASRSSSRPRSTFP